MDPIALPASMPLKEVTFSLSTNTRIFTSPFTQGTQRLAMPGARWKASYVFAPLTRQEASPWQAFLAELDGAAQTFFANDPAATIPQGTGSGVPLVDGGGQSGSQLITNGWSPSQTVLKAGDYFQIGSELKMITANAVSDISGSATLKFKPALRSIPADNAPLIVTNPHCVMRLVDDEQTSWHVDESRFYTLQFSAIEAF
jgi:hypothetical protein